MALLKDRIRTLIAEKDALEREIEESSLRLQIAGIGMKDSLVDKEVCIVQKLTKTVIFCCHGTSVLQLRIVFL